MSDFKKYLRETRNTPKDLKESEDLNESLLLLAPLAAKLFPGLGKGLLWSIKKLMDSNKKAKEKAQAAVEKGEADAEEALRELEDSELTKAFEEIDLEDDDAVAALKSLEDKIAKRRDPKAFLETLRKRNKLDAPKAVKKDAEVQAAAVATSDAEKDSEDAEENMGAASDGEMGDAADAVQTAQDNEDKAKEDEKDLEDPDADKDSEEEDPDADKDSEEEDPDSEETGDKEDSANKDIEQKIDNLKSNISNVDDDKKKVYKAWMEYYSELLKSDDPESVKKPEGSAPRPKKKDESVKESYIRIAGYWADK